MTFLTEFNINSFAISSTPKFNEVVPDEIYDVIIIGCGPAGINAAIYASRKGLKTGIVAARKGGRLNDTTSVENYLGIPGVSGEELALKFITHLNMHDINMSDDVLITKSSSNPDENNFHHLFTDDNRHYITKAIILTTGAKQRLLDVPGELQFADKGVSYCAICDGPVYAKKDVAVAGGGNSAVEAAIDLSKIANRVTLIQRSTLRADKVLVDKMNTISNIEIKLNTKIISVNGNSVLESLTLVDNNDIKTEISVAALFVEIGIIPEAGIFSNLLQTNQRGEVIVDRKMRTSAKGIFAAGDVTDTPYRQIITAASDGAVAALSANDYINSLN